MVENSAARFYRELRVDRIWEGTSEIQRSIISRGVFKRGAAPYLGWECSSGSEPRVTRGACRGGVSPVDPLDSVTVPVGDEDTVSSEVLR